MTKDQYREDHFTRDQLNKFRIESGLKPLIPKSRPCMCCDKKFISEGPHNRLCRMCTQKHPEGYSL